MKILILGSGVMAAGIAGRLANYHDVTILSRHLDPAIKDFRVAATIEEATFESYAAILSCVADDHRSRALWLDERMDALIRRDRPIVVELSTLSLNWIEEWHRRMNALEVVAVESPVTGSREGAEAGTLSSFRFAEARSRVADEIFAVFTDRIYEFSAPVSPMRFKLIYNSWGGGYTFNSRTTCRAADQASARRHRLSVDNRPVGRLDGSPSQLKMGEISRQRF